MNNVNNLVRSSTQISDTAYLLFLKEKLEGDFKAFVRYFFKHRKGSKFIFAAHHDKICDKLMDVYHGRTQHLIINIAPRYSKTELVIILFSAWCIAKSPRSEFIHLSYSDTLALDNSNAVRDVIKSLEFQQLWPSITVQPHKDSKRAWATSAGGVFMATMTGGQVTGFGAGRMDDQDADGNFVFSGAMLIDDPLKPDDARHDTLREGANRRWDETIKSRFNSPRTPCIVIMQRIHQKDFTAMLLEDSEFKWDTLILPSLINEGTTDERALWPEKHTVAQLHAMRDKKNDLGQSNPIAREAFSAQHQQNPTPAGGGIFQEVWWRYYTESVPDVIARCSAFVITADTAYTSNNANDPSSIGFWGAEGGRKLNRLDEAHGHWEFPDLLYNTAVFCLKHPRYSSLLVENKASGPSLVQTLRKGIRLECELVVYTDIGERTVYPQGHLVQIRAQLWTPKGYGYPEDKVGRAKEASWQVHGGNIVLPSLDATTPAWQPWVRPYIDEFGAFTASETHAHDDRVDDTTMAVSWWTKYGGGRSG